MGRQISPNMLEIKTQIFSFGEGIHLAGALHYCASALCVDLVAARELGLRGKSPRPTKSLREHFSIGCTKHTRTCATIHRLLAS